MTLGELGLLLEGLVQLADTLLIFGHALAHGIVASQGSFLRVPVLFRVNGELWLL